MDVGVTLPSLKSVCATCSMRELCMPIGLSDTDLAHIDTLVGARTRLRKGETLYRAGDPLTGLFAVRVGSLKTAVLAEDGREQVAGFHMSGEIVGLDGMGTEWHVSHAVALEDSEVCVMPLERLEKLAHDMPTLQRNLRRFLAREIGRQQSVMLMLGSMRAEERLAAFLLDLGARYRRRGYSGSEFVLRMTREEIGSYLGLTLETVSRLLSRFQQEGLIRVQGRGVTLLDQPALRELCGRKA